jgi:hypothetical protein
MALAVCPKYKSIIHNISRPVYRQYSIALTSSTYRAIEYEARSHYCLYTLRKLQHGRYHSGKASTSCSKSSYVWSKSSRVWNLILIAVLASVDDALGAVKDVVDVACNALGCITTTIHSTIRATATPTTTPIIRLGARAVVPAPKPLPQAPKPAPKPLVPVKDRRFAHIKV